MTKEIPLEEIEQNKEIKLKTIIVNLKIKLNQLDTKLIQLKEIQDERDVIKSSLELLCNTYNINQNTLEND